MLCSLHRCGGKLLARGLCCKHYNRLKAHGDPLKTKLPRTSFFDLDGLRSSLLERRIMNDRGCWLWTLSKTRGGYGQVWVGAKRYSIHRVSAKIWLGFNLKSHFLILHKCDNRNCFNPEHLFIGDHNDNTEDMMRKNRQAKGEENGQSKLTESKVRKIRSLLSLGESQAAIAKKFHVNQTLVSAIHRRVVWKHIN